VPEVVLLYERACPNVATARANLSQAFLAVGLPASWREVDIDAPDTPQDWRRMGSPTILIDGSEVGGSAEAEGACCRVFENDGRLERAPSVDSIVLRLLSIQRGRTSDRA
jgi:hypothetical protein